MKRACRTQITNLFDKEHFYEKLEELKEMAYAEDSADIRKKIMEVVDTYHPQNL